MRIQHNTRAVFFILILAVDCLAQATASPSPANPTVFLVAPTYIQSALATAFARRHVPLTITQDQDHAQYTLKMRTKFLSAKLFAADDKNPIWKWKPTAGMRVYSLKQAFLEDRGSNHQGEVFSDALNRFLSTHPLH